MPCVRRSLLVAALTLLFACSPAAELARKVTYPPDFSYIKSDEVKSTMEGLAVSVNLLNRELRAQPLDEAARGRVVALLSSMQATAAQLVVPQSASNHPLLDDKLPSFQRDVASALDSAKADPPNYFLAGTLVGSCLHCHDRPR